MPRGAPGGSAHPRAVLSDELVRELRRLRREEDGWTYPQLAELVSETIGRPVHRETIRLACLGKRYRSVED